MAERKRYLEPAEYLHDQWRLAAAVRASGWRPDILVGLWRGGTPAAIAVHEFLAYSGWKTRHFPLKTASYTGIGENGGEVEFFLWDEVSPLFAKGCRVLFVDDIFDTGKTAAALRGRMAATGAEMRLGCVYRKAGCNTTGFEPDYVAKDIGPEWLVFPHEMEGLTDGEIREKDALLAELLK